MVATSPDVLRRLRAPGYLIIGLAAILPLSDLISTVWPPHAGQLMWRFGTVGLGASAIGVPLFLMFLLFALAAVLGDSRVILTIAIVSAVIALLLVLGVGAFTLDTLQMRGGVSPSAMPRFKAASGQALVKLLLHAISATVLAISAFRVARGDRKESGRSGSAKASPLMVGRASRGVPPLGAREGKAAGSESATEPPASSLDEPAAPELS